MAFLSMHPPYRSRRTRLRMALPMLLLALECMVPAHADDFFEKQVRPLLVQRCYQCHGGKKASGGLSLETASGWRKGGESGPAIVPGKVAESLLIDAINYRSLKMPPPGGERSQGATSGYQVAGWDEFRTGAIMVGLQAPAPGCSWRDASVDRRNGQ